MSYDRIVLIDDNESDNVFHELMLRRAGHTAAIEIFESAADALDALTGEAETKRTLILLDINMPGMNGFDFAERLADLEARDWVTIVMLSSSSATLDIARAKEIPAIAGYIVKPLQKELAKELLDGHIPREVGEA